MLVSPKAGLKLCGKQREVAWWCRVSVAVELSTDVRASHQKCLMKCGLAFFDALQLNFARLEEFENHTAFAQKRLFYYLSLARRIHLIVFGH